MDGLHMQLRWEPPGAGASARLALELRVRSASSRSPPLFRDYLSQPLHQQLCWAAAALSSDAADCILTGCDGADCQGSGAFVATTCGTRNVQFVTEVLKADQAIDYTKEK